MNPFGTLHEKKHLFKTEHYWMTQVGFYCFNNNKTSHMQDHVHHNDKACIEEYYGQQYQKPFRNQ